MHYARLQRGQELSAPKRYSKGYTHHSGYRYVHKPSHPNASKCGQIAEHRFVMSEYLGRPLFEHENVHHKNGDRADNRLENLELWSHSQPNGQRVEDKLAWAKALIVQYQPGQDNNWDETYRPSMWG